MTRVTPWRRIAGWGLGAAAACALAATPGTPAPVAPRTAQAAPAGSAVLPAGWARVSLAGRLVAATPSTGIVSLEIEGPGRADVFEGGTAWRSRSLYGTHLIRLLQATVMIDAGGRPVARDAVHSGEHASVWGVMTPEDDIMALSMVVPQAQPAVRPVPPGGAAPDGLAGVVAARSGSTLDVITDAGVRRAVLLTAATQVRAGGSAAVGVAPFDLVRIDGSVNSDGSIVAGRVLIDFIASDSAQVSGPVEYVRSDLGGLVVGGTMVCTSAETYFVRGVSRLAITGLPAARPVTVYGVPIVAGRTPVGLAARVVAVR
jgi:hypothetical protein